MANKYHKNLTGNGTYHGGVETPKGGSQSVPSKQGTAAWPGVPGSTQPRSRSGGAPTTGSMGSFEVKKVGL